MNLIGTICPVSGHAMNNDDGELCMRVTSSALAGGATGFTWLVSDNHGGFYEPPPREAQQLEDAWQKIRRGEVRVDMQDDIDLPL